MLKINEQHKEEFKILKLNTIEDIKKIEKDNKLTI